jgi:hypothetical protein
VDYNEVCGIDPIECEIGWKIKAVPGAATFLFAFEHRNEVVPVRKGIDKPTHLNLVTNYKPNLVITPTRSNGH